jgi:hypothetical protein
LRATRDVISYNRPRDTIGRTVDAGFCHLVLLLPAPYPDAVARWVTDEIVAVSTVC